MRTVDVTVPALVCRHDVRGISGVVADIDGVVAVEVDVQRRLVRVHGTAPASEVVAALTTAGYRAAGAPERTG